MLISFTASGLQNGRPDSLGDKSISLLNRASHVFTVANFTTETTPPYNDPEGDALAYIQIKSLPLAGSLEVNSVPVVLDQIISAGDISTGNLIYSSPDQDGADVNSFDFDVADVGSSTASGLPPGTVTISSAATINLPPDVVGNKEFNIQFSQTSIVFTAADFTSGTTPAYNDPEGDLPQSVKILTLPAEGVLKYNGVPVVVNQIITISEIDSGYLIYESNLSNVNLYNDTFNFAVSDAGSGQFTPSS